VYQTPSVSISIKVPQNNVCIGGMSKEALIVFPEVIDGISKGPSGSVQSSLPVIATPAWKFLATVLATVVYTFLIF